MLPDRVSNPGPLTYESGAKNHAVSQNLYNLFWKYMYSILSNEILLKYLFLQP